MIQPEVKFLFIKTAALIAGNVCFAFSDFNQRIAAPISLKKDTPMCH